MEEDWVYLEKMHEYELPCKYCKQNIIIRQTGDPLDLCILNKLLFQVHVNHTFDALEKYENGVKINIEISNKKCIKKQI